MIVRSLVSLLLWLTAIGHCNVNLFITKEEMSRTLGVSAELSYIEDGIVNAYSTKFPYRVDTNVSQVKFSWNAATKVEYSLRVVAEDAAVLPVLRIARVGFVPLHTQEFAVEYRCAGSKAGQFEVALYLNLTYPNKNVTRLKLKQEKLCAPRGGRRLHGGMDDMDSGRIEDSERWVSAEQVFYIIIGCAACFLALIAFLLTFYFRGSKKDTSQAATPVRSRLPGSFRSTRTAQSQQPFLTSTPNKSMVSTASRYRPGTSASSSTQSATVSAIVYDKASNVDVKQALVELYADRNLFQMLNVTEMQGTFGEVKWAIWRQTSSGESGDIDEEEDAGVADEAVLCKTLKATAGRAQFEKFLGDALVFHKVRPHANLAQVCAAATFGRFDNPETVTDFPLLCYRHQGFGNLKNFLLSCRADGTTSKEKGGQTLRTHELVSMGMQICRAMIHLHRFGYLHKDIAARNCLVAEQPGRKAADRLHVQLCDNALAKDLWPGDYHCLGDNENRPVCWQAPEVLVSNTNTSASDVWSYGVTLWELMSCGAQPLAGYDPDDILSALNQGMRPAQPYNCPDQLYNVMYCCWRAEPLERPTSEQLLIALQEFTQQLRQFI